MTTERMTPDTLTGLRAGRDAILKIGFVASSWEERGLIDAMNELDATIAERDALRTENEQLRAVGVLQKLECNWLYDLLGVTIPDEQIVAFVKTAVALNPELTS